MVVVSWKQGLNAGGWKFAPFARYVISDSLFRRMVEDLVKQGFGEPVHSWSCFNSYERRYGGQDLNGKTLAIYRENGFGDNLIVSGLTGYLKSKYPTAKIDLYSMPRTVSAWQGSQDANFHDVPPAFDSVKEYDYHVFLEGMIENNQERDQGNAYDDLYSFCGIKPKDVPKQFKRPQIWWTDEDNAAEEEWLKIRPAGDYVVWHWNPSGLVRQYPFEQCREAIRLLAERFAVVIIGNTDGEIEAPALDLPNVLDLTNKTPTVRSFLPIMKHAKAVICGDSCVLHMAPCFPDVPCIGLFGPFAHADRSLYYANVTPLDEMQVCPFAPCRGQQSTLPVQKCKQATGYQDGTRFCTALAAITPQRILSETLKAIK